MVNEGASSVSEDTDSDTDEEANSDIDINVKRESKNTSINVSEVETDTKSETESMDSDISGSQFEVTEGSPTMADIPWASPSPQPRFAVGPIVVGLCRTAKADLLPRGAATIKNMLESAVHSIHGSAFTGDTIQSLKVLGTQKVSFSVSSKELYRALLLGPAT